MKFNKSYKFTFRNSLLITLFSIVTLGVLVYLFTGKVIVWLLLIFSVLLFVFSFFIIQYRVEHFIYRRIKKIYDNVSLLDAENFNRKSITTDMETLSREVQKFAENKKMEIETLLLREGYRREFLGNISHELKTPLFTVQGYILTLLEGAVEDKKIRHKYLKRASKSVDRLIYIVRDLDMISKLETGKLNLNTEAFDLVEMIHGVYDMLEMKARKNDISLTFDKDYIYPIMVNGDIERIEQVLINLVVNSVKYGKKGGTTVLSMSDADDNKILISIKDNGEGIEAIHLPRLFERFFRVDQSRSREQGGSGLGLSIVKHILEAHQESITVKSNYGEGSEFSFTLTKAS